MGNRLDLQDKVTYAIPVHWNMTVLEEVLNLKNKAEKTYGGSIDLVFYGSIPGLTIASGRIKSSLVEVSIEEAAQYIQRIHEAGCKFRYLFNAPNSLLKSNSDEVSSVLKQVLHGLCADELTIAQLELIDFARAHYPKVPVTLSTIAGVRNPSQVRLWSEKGVRNICLHHDANRDIPNLREIIKEADERGVNLELMLTENCVHKCPVRSQHYSQLGKNFGSTAKIDDYQIPCWLDKIATPSEIIAASWINPEGVEFYERLGIHQFKITGRDKKATRLPLIVKAYLNRNFEGNFMRLLGTAPQSVDGHPVEAESLVWINNKALVGFYDSLDQALLEGSYKKFCIDFTRHLFEKGDLKILDEDSEYEISDGNVVLKNPGEFYNKTLKYIQQKEVFLTWTKIRGH